MLWFLRFVKLNRNTFSLSHTFFLQLPYGFEATNEGTLRSVSIQILCDSKLLLGDPEPLLFLSLCCDVDHGWQNLGSQFDKLLWLIPTYRTSLVNPNQTWPYPSTFYLLFCPYSRVYVSFHYVAFSVEYRFESLLSTLSSFASGTLAWLIILYDHF